MPPVLAVIDGHADVFSKAVEEGLDYLDDAERFQASLARLGAGGVVLQWASIYVPKTFSGEAATAEAMAIVDAAEDVARRRGPDYALVRDLVGLRSATRAKPGDPPRFLLAMEGASPLRGSRAVLETFTRRGLRVLGLTHNHDNECGDGCFAKNPAGLTPVGFDLLRAAEDRGVILDTAHLNPVAFDQVIAAARRPVVYTHGGSRALCDVPRNLTDAQARAVAASGGVLGVDVFSGHVTPPGRPGTMEDVVDHLDYWIRLVGAAHVGIGGDFDGIPQVLDGAEDASCYPAVFAALSRRGHGPEVIESVASLNWLRVLEHAFGDDS